MPFSVEFRSRIRADKFYPPQVEGSGFVRRQKLIDELVKKGRQFLPTVILEAQAGQGKTTLIKQYLNALGLDFAWYQIDPEDADPAFFLQALQVCISSVITNFPSTETRSLLSGLEFSQIEPERIMNLLLQDLGQRVSKSMYLVFDDLQFLLKFPQSIDLLSYFLQTAPPNVHFIFSSRNEIVDLVESGVGRNRTIVKFDNAELAFQESEIKELCHTMFSSGVSGSVIQEVARITEGWPMGVRLYGLRLGSTDSKEYPFSTFSPGVDLQEDIRDYFIREVFSQLDEEIHIPLLQLSLLEHISVDLAIKLTGDAAIGDKLQSIAGRNLFLRSIGFDHMYFDFHHLFRESLRLQAQQRLESSELERIYEIAGRWYEQEGDPALAMRYFLMASDYEMVEKVLQDSGMFLLARNQTFTLLTILNEVPLEIIRNLGWSSFYLGIASLDSTPVRALPLLKDSLACFTLHENRVGELLALSHIISIIIMTFGHYREGEKYLQRAEQLYSDYAEQLSPTMFILVSRSLSMGEVIFEANSPKALTYINRALKVARSRSMDSLEAALLMVKGYAYIFAGKTELTKLALEEAAPFAHRPEIGQFNVLAIRMMLFNFHFHNGDFFNYFEQKKQLISALGNLLVSQSIAGPFCYVWEMDIAISKGRFDAALDLAERALSQEPSYGIHITSQILQLKAVICAFKGKENEALSLIEQSTELRNETGSPYFVTLNKIIAGVTRSLCRQLDHGLELLDEAITNAKEMPTQYLEACALLHKGAILVQRGDYEIAREVLADGMQKMRKNCYNHFWAWIPQHMQQVFRFCIAEEIEPLYAKELARRTLGIEFTKSGGAVPLLFFRTLGEFRIESESKQLFKANEFTPKQREFLGLLLVSPDNSLSSDLIKLHFWPDSPSEQLQNKLDTLISRLRKTFGRRLQGVPPSKYLQREKGIVRLNYVQCDCQLFFQHVQNGVEHHSHQRYWQAENEFQYANSFWQGGFTLGVGESERILSLRMRLLSTVEDLVRNWSDILTATDRNNEAIQLVQKALHDDWLNDRLFGLLYRLEKKESSVRAQQVVEIFEKRLQQEAYDAAEIAQLLETIIDF